VSAAQPRVLHVVRPPDPARVEGGTPPDLDGETWPYLKLPDARYAIIVTSWRLGPIPRSARPIRRGAAEREGDSRLYVVGRITCPAVGAHRAP
jgi:hypothetical protein